MKHIKLYENFLSKLEDMVKGKTEKAKFENEINEDLTKKITTGSGWDAKEKSVKQGNLELQSIAKQIYLLFKKEGLNPTMVTSRAKINASADNKVVIMPENDDLTITIKGISDPMGMANKYGPMIIKQFPKMTISKKPEVQTWTGQEHVVFILSLTNGGPN